MNGKGRHRHRECQEEEHTAQEPEDEFGADGSRGVFLADAVHHSPS